MKAINFLTWAISLAAPILAQEFFPALNNTPAVSVAARNPLDRRAVDYCYASSYYCINTLCCGITSYNCLPTGAECCSSLSAYGFGLFCPSGSTCVIESGYVQCQRTSGGFESAESSLAPTATGTSSGTASQTRSVTSETTSSTTDESESDSKTKTKKKKSKAWIAGAVVGPLLGIALIAAVTFFLSVVKKNKAKKAAAANTATIMAQNNTNNQGYYGNGKPEITPAPPTQIHQDQKPTMFAHTQSYDNPPTPLGSPPPQWTPPAQPQPQTSTTPSWPGSSPASPSPTVVAPVPIAAHTNNVVPPPNVPNELYGGQAVGHQSQGPVSPMNTGDGYGGGVAAQQQQQQQQHNGWQNSNAMELPTAPPVQNVRGGAHELS
ncbi:unnamed protein product [Periconia digitata]|uniref:Uncharacterized protein n=1 Tax=Periconia digitata TaxID=1303443 RepID=A0A9W4UFQ3_9PLEO|nr:unnamed protein product [Periconia digitata]